MAGLLAMIVSLDLAMRVWACLRGEGAARMAMIGEANVACLARREEGLLVRRVRIAKMRTAAKAAVEKR